MRPSCSCSLAPPSQSRGSLTSASSSNSSTSSGYCAEVNDDTDSSEDDYHDAVEEVVPDDSVDGTTEAMVSSADSSSVAVIAKSKRQRRKRVPDRAKGSFSVWTFIKNNIGKDFAKSPLPVNLNEPLSLLQRLAEQGYNSTENNLA